MAKALFVNQKDVKIYTSLNGNIDPDKLIQYIDIAQDIHVLNYLGQALYQRLQDDVLNSTLTGDYLTLVEDYVKPMLVHWASAEYLPWAAYTMSNKGVYKHGAENSETVSKNEVDYLQGKRMEIAQNYTRRMIDYICLNEDKFPEYKENGQRQVKPDKTSENLGWYLG